MENQKQPFKNFEKITAEIFFKIHWETPPQESHFNKLAYLKPTILLKGDSHTDPL